MGLKEKLKQATWDWFKASLKEYRGNPVDDAEGKKQRAKLTTEVRNCLQEFFSRYVRMRLVALMSDSTRVERAEAAGPLVQQLETHLDFFSKSCTQSIEGEFVYIGEELEEADPPDHKEYILNKIGKTIDEFIDTSEQLADYVIEREFKSSADG